jgi:hypothetical protein
MPHPLKVSFLPSLSHRNKYLFHSLRGPIIQSWKSSLSPSLRSQTTLPTTFSAAGAVAPAPMVMLTGDFYYFLLSSSHPKLPRALALSPLTSDPAQLKWAFRTSQMWLSFSYLKAPTSFLCTHNETQMSCYGLGDLPTWWDCTWFSLAAF